MHRWVLVVWAILAATSLSGAAEATSAVSYDISPVFRSGELVAVAIDFRFQGDQDGETRLVLPDEWGGETELWKQVSDLTVTGGTVRLDGPQARIVRHRPGASLRVRYRIVSGYQGDPSNLARNAYLPIVRPTWFHFLGPTSFIYPEDRDSAAVQVRWTGWPKGWTLASDLDHGAQGSPLTVDGLVDSVSVGGTDIRVLFRPIRGGQLRFAVRGDRLQNEDAFADYIARVLSAQRGFFGEETGPFFVSLIPVEVEPNRISVGGTALGDGFALFASKGEVEPFMRTIMAHEHVHSWIPGRLGRLQDDEIADYWFSEGFTDFYTYRTLLRSGIWSLEDYVAAVNKALAEYDGSEGRNWSNSRVGEAFWSNRTAGRIPYLRGTILALRWDYDLRSASQGRAGLDQVIFRMRDRSRDLKGQEKPLLRDALSEAMRAFGIDPAADIQRYIEQGEDLPLPPDLFGACGSLTVSTVTEPGGSSRQVRRFDLKAGMDEDARQTCWLLMSGGQAPPL